MMKKYLFNYQTSIRFSQPVLGHSIFLRCQPCNCSFQNIEEEHLTVAPDFWLRHSVDTFGNRTVHGGTRMLHNSFSFISTGIVAVGDYVIPSGIAEPYYRVYTPLTFADETMKDIRADNTHDIMTKAMDISQMVFDMMTYTPCSTSTETSAVEVFRNRMGVCQDYTHLFISLCLANGIVARYANGFLLGTGETHAWAEVFDGYAWRGIDPTHNSLITDSHIKIAHGRDASDCSVARGTYLGMAQQETSVHVEVVEI